MGNFFNQGGGGDNPLFAPFMDSLKIATTLSINQRRLDAEKEKYDQLYKQNAAKILMEAHEAQSKRAVDNALEAFKLAAPNTDPNNPQSVKQTLALGRNIEELSGAKFLPRDENGLSTLEGLVFGKKNSDKGFGSSSLGIYDKETGAITTPAMPRDKKGKLYVDKVDLGDKVRMFKADGSYDDIDKGKSPAQEGMVDKRRVTDERALRKDFTSLPEVKNHELISSQVQRLEKAMEENKSGGSKIAVDQALITILNKMLDPQSVVRESEYARTPQDMALWNRIKGKFEKWSTGGAGLTDDDRNAIYSMVRKFYSVSESMYNQQVDYFTDLAKDYGYAPENIVRLGGTRGGSKYEKRKSTESPKYPQDFSDDELRKKLGF